ncbi:MAG: hypothetical protein KY475_04715, partial [Planctomycetes bacterium]|nr:hypothetical protein [Planctomycetota bacterium]
PDTNPAPADDPPGAPPAAHPHDTQAPPAADPFGAPPAAEPEEKEEPAGDDPFGAPPPAAEPEAPASDDPFGAPPAAESGAAADDIFGAALPDDSGDVADSEEPAPADDAAGSLDDLFAPPPAPEQPATEEAKEPAADPFGAADSLPERLWTDNTGTFEIRGRLAGALDEKIRILKDNGRYTTVPMRRLSDADQQYVAERVAEMRNQEESLIAGQ